MIVAFDFFRQWIQFSVVYKGRGIVFVKEKNQILSKKAVFWHSLYLKWPLEVTVELSMSDSKINKTHLCQYKHKYGFIIYNIEKYFFSVERRRRDKINNWIVTLSKIIPDCSMDSTKTGAVSSLSASFSTSFFWNFAWSSACPFRVKEASCRKPATTSGSSGKATSDSRRVWRKWRGYKWTMSCAGSRY